mmetsp:Transcript_26509/g.64607  ORF Transcript_26509/g.64607 Transcript_26509/m.64607 type:complete len:125 (-) Transcript_26509:662-1036(-)
MGMPKAFLDSMERDVMVVIVNGNGRMNVVLLEFLGICGRYSTARRFLLCSQDSPNLFHFNDPVTKLTRYRMIRSTKGYPYQYYRLKPLGSNFQPTVGYGIMKDTDAINLGGVAHGGLLLFISPP